MGKLIHVLRQIDRYSISHLRAGHLKKIARFALKKPQTLIMGYPRHILIEPTLRCNIRCPLCPSPMHLNPRMGAVEFMSLETFKTAVDHCRDILYRVYLTFSGEPLLHPELEQMIEYLTRCGIVSMISTNGTLLTARRAQALIHAGLDYLIISFDGFSRESFESFRCGARFDKTRANIEGLGRLKEKLRSPKPYVDVQWIVNRLNEPELKDAEQYFQDLPGIDEFHVKSMSLNEHIYDEEEVGRLKERFLPTNSKIRSQYLDRGPRPGAPARCPHLFSPVILASGDVTICCIDFRGEYVVGNIRSSSFRSLWHSEFYKRLREKADRFELPICRKCPIRYN